MDFSACGGLLLNPGILKHSVFQKVIRNFAICVEVRPGGCQPSAKCCEARIDLRPPLQLESQPSIITCESKIEVVHTKSHMVPNFRKKQSFLASPH